VGASLTASLLVESRRSAAAMARPSEGPGGALFARPADECEREPANVVITDIIMPKLNGIDAIHRIVREFPSVRIVAISGGGNFDPSSYQPAAITTTAYLLAAKKAGAHHILTKPFESAELIDAVKRVIGAGHG